MFNNKLECFAGGCKYGTPWGNERLVASRFDGIKDPPAVGVARMMSLLAQVQEREPDPVCRAELTNLERTLLAGERSLAYHAPSATDDIARLLERINAAYWKVCGVP
jgi:hypothetical protein